MSIQSARGARAGRIVRVARLIRFARVAKLYRYYFVARRKQRGAVRHAEGDEAAAEASGAGHDEEDSSIESRVGMRLADLTTRRIIVGVLIMLVVIPLLLPLEDDQSSTVGLELLRALGQQAESDSSLLVRGTRIWPLCAGHRTLAPSPSSAPSAGRS